MFSDIPGRFCVEYKSCKIYPFLVQLPNLFKLGHSTNFYSHQTAFFNWLTNEAKAIAGSASFINTSPIRKPLKPNFLRWQTVSALLIPLSAIFIFSGSILLLKATDRLMSTVKVF